MRRDATEGLDVQQDGMNQTIQEPSLDARGRQSGRPPTSYVEWVDRVEAENDRLRPERQHFLATVDNLPLISILMPVYRPDIRHLQEAIASVKAQSYSNWELCVVDDASADQSIDDLLTQQSSEDRRIRAKSRQTNGHICAASNDALQMCRGLFTALLDHDDLLHRDALFWIFSAMHQQPDCNLVFTDEDKLCWDGKRHDPNFKHRLDMELLRAQNFISHLGAYRTTLLKDLGGFRAGFEGSQDYDLVLRVCEQSWPNKVVHVPRVLYHWRFTPVSASFSHTNKPYTRMAARRAIEGHLARTHLPGRVCQTQVPGVHRVIPAAPTSEKKTVLVLVGKHEGPLDQPRLRKLLRPILGHLDEVVSAYPEGTIEGIFEGAERRYLPEKLRFLSAGSSSQTEVAALDEAIAATSSEKIVLVDHRATPCLDQNFLAPSAAPQRASNWLIEIVGQLARLPNGVVGGRTVDGAGRVIQCGFFFNSSAWLHPVAGGSLTDDPGYWGRNAILHEVSAVRFECMGVSRRTYHKLGGFDRRFSHAYGDVDFCLRVRAAGGQVVASPYASVMLPQARTDSQAAHRAGLGRLLQKHGKRACTELFLSQYLVFRGGLLCLDGMLQPAGIPGPEQLRQGGQCIAP